METLKFYKNLSSNDKTQDTLPCSTQLLVLIKMVNHLKKRDLLQTPSLNVKYTIYFDLKKIKNFRLLSLRLNGDANQKAFEMVK